MEGKKHYESLQQKIKERREYILAQNKATYEGDFNFGAEVANDNELSELFLKLEKCAFPYGQRNKKIYTYQNKFWSLSEIAVEFKINESTLRTRLRKGMSIETAISESGKYDKLYFYRNQHKTLKQLAEIYQFKLDIVRNRLRNGWKIEQAIETPILTKQMLVQRRIDRKMESLRRLSAKEKQIKNSLIFLQAV